LESVTPSEAAALLMEVVYEFNACVPYSGVPPGAEVEGVEGASLLALAGLLPVHVSMSASLTSDDVKQVRCAASGGWLQRIPPSCVRSVQVAGGSDL
jgi:hypothetical protein